LPDSLHTFKAVYPWDENLYGVCSCFLGHDYFSRDPSWDLFHPPGAAGMEASPGLLTSLMVRASPAFSDLYGLPVKYSNNT
jgi:hypothetical protein